MENIEPNLLLEMSRTVQQLRTELEAIKHNQMQQQQYMIEQNPPTNKRSRVQEESEEMTRNVPCSQFTRHEAEMSLGKFRNCHTEGFEMTLQTSSRKFYKQFW